MDSTVDKLVKSQTILKFFSFSGTQNNNSILQSTMPTFKKNKNKNKLESEVVMKYSIETDHLATLSGQKSAVSV